MRLLVPSLVTALVVGCGGPDFPPAPRPQPAQAGKSDKEQVLNAILQDVLESDFLKEVRADYGIEGRKEVALVSNADYGAPWPDNFCPVLPEGYQVRRVTEGSFGGQDQPRLLGIRIDKFSIDKTEVELFRETIVITVMNAGGTKNGGIIGGCSVYYVPVRKEGGWVVESTRLEDP